MDELVSALKKLNLTEKEAKVYLTLLQLGPSTPYRIAKKASLKRPTAYVIAEELVEKGLIVPVAGEQKRMYIARSPEAYIDEVGERVRDARRILPELLALQKKTSEKPNILYFEGIEGMKQAYAYRLQELHGKEMVGFFARASDADEEIQREVFVPWNMYKEKHNIRVRGYMPDDPSLQPYTAFLSSGKSIIGKYLPVSLYGADCSLEIADTWTRISFVQAKQSLIIESKKFATAMRQVFELLWQKTKGEFDAPSEVKLTSKNH